MQQWVAWLRGVNVGKAGAGRKAVPMAELRALAAELGWQGAQTYIQSGNLVFEARGSAASLARAHDLSPRMSHVLRRESVQRVSVH